MGHDVLVAENGEVAIRVFNAHPEQIRFVVLDMGMPVMGGAECFTRLRTRSDVPVLIADGLRRGRAGSRAARRGSVDPREAVHRGAAPRAARPRRRLRTGGMSLGPAVG